MAKRKPAPKATIYRKDVRSIPTRTDPASVEEETIRRVDRTLGTIGDFLSRWDSSDLKPESMYPHVQRIKRFQQELSAWEREAVKARSKADDGARMKRLRDFVLICRTYS
ncbi:hypothetical protein H0O00_05595 [Candidatus Micrarchaeota archaeon]|nr:hypothetical protein [Candidatus Micrarchaeota archaeon]